MDDERGFYLGPDDFEAIRPGDFDYLLDDDGNDWEADDERYMMFQDPGGELALRLATEDNPRNLPCPTCGEPDRLTEEDRRLGYQCNSCAREQERGY